MQLGLGLLGLSPTQFWAMTPKELEAAISGLSGGDAGEPLSRSTLNDLLLQFPDEVKNA